MILISQEKTGQVICKKWRLWSGAAEYLIWVYSVCHWLMEKWKYLSGYIFYLEQCRTFKLITETEVQLSIALCMLGKTFSGRYFDFFFFLSENITKTCLFQYTENFTSKIEKFQIKNSDIFLISAQNIDCGYSLELPRVPTIYVLSRNKKNNVNPCKPQFYYIKLEFKGVSII